MGAEYMIQLEAGKPWFALKTTPTGGWRRAYDIYLPAVLEVMRET